MFPGKFAQRELNVQEFAWCFLGWGTKIKTIQKEGYQMI